MITSRNRMLAITVVLVAIAVVAVPGAVAEGPEPAAAAADGVIAYYFHGNVRCSTCRKIEAYADEAIAGGFADELSSDRIEWRVVNVDVNANTHFIEDFQLVTRSVVLAEYRDGKVVRWQNLDKVWQLVRDKDRFVDYVQSELNEFLGEG